MGRAPALGVKTLTPRVRTCPRSLPAVLTVQGAGGQGVCASGQWDSVTAEAEANEAGHGGEASRPPAQVQGQKQDPKGKADKLTGTGQQMDPTVKDGRAACVATRQRCVQAAALGAAPGPGPCGHPDPTCEDPAGEGSEGLGAPRMEGAPTQPPQLQSGLTPPTAPGSQNTRGHGGLCKRAFMTSMLLKMTECKPNRFIKTRTRCRVLLSYFSHKGTSTPA